MQSKVETRKKTPGGVRRFAYLAWLVVQGKLTWTRDLQKRFTQVYRENLWQSPETASGSGSQRDSGSVAHSIAQLKRAVEELGIRSINDIPCGDFNWMDMFLADHPGIAYAGFDIVPELIARNAQKHPSVRFQRLDVTVGVPPRADLIFCKDLFNHLKYADVARAIDNMRASGSTYLLASNNFGEKNRELLMNAGGESRHLDLTAAPLNYPAPIWHDHYLGLWKLDALVARR